jgi:3-oxoacyl-[acyl-carrier-protein] synthase II
MRDVVITGIGLVSSAGEGLEAHLTALAGGDAPNTDATTFEPFPVHPVTALEWDRQIPKKSDQRQMEAWHPCSERRRPQGPSDAPPGPLRRWRPGRFP